MPLHFILSECMICVAALWGAARLVRDRQATAALGVALFGLAAVIGIVRIATGADALLGPPHRVVSQAGGAAGLVLIVAQIARRRGMALQPVTGLLCAGAAMLAAIVAPAATGFVVLAALAGGVVLLASHPDRSRGGIAAAAFAVMGPNVLLVRQSPLLDPAVSWHAYHLVTAAWLAAAVMGLTHLRPQPRILDRDAAAASE